MRQDQQTETELRIQLEALQADVDTLKVQNQALLAEKAQAVETQQMLVAENARLLTLCQQNEERIRAFISLSGEGIWRYDLAVAMPLALSEKEQVDFFYEHGFLAECNDAMARMYGYSQAADLVGTSLGVLLSPSDPQNLEMLRAFIRSGYRLVDVETLERDIEGQRKYFLNNLVGIIEGAFLMGAWGTQRDISARKQAEERLRFLGEAGSLLSTSLEYQTTLATLVQLTVPFIADMAVLYTLNKDGRLEPVDVAHRDPAQRDALWEVVRSYQASLRAHPPAAEVVQRGQSFLQADVGSEQIALLATNEAQEGMLAALGIKSYMLVPLQVRGQIVGVLTLARGASQQLYTPEDVAVVEELARRAAIAMDNARLYEDAQQALRMREQFLGVASHELRTPLTAIRGHADLLLRHSARQGATDERWVRSVRVIQQEVLRLTQLIGLLLDMSRLQANRLELAQQAVDVVVLVARLVETWQPTLPRHTLEVVGAESGMIVWGDALRLEQILYNLLGNAIKYSPDGGQIMVRLGCHQDWVSIAITDPGVGIPDDELPLIFEEYYRVNPQSSTPAVGVGLGLYVVRRLVEAHGGTIQVVSEVGAGSTFTIQLPHYREGSDRPE